jgi:hypothetical protein
MHFPPWLRFEPVLRHDAEGFMALALPYRSEGFAEDLEDLPPSGSTRRMPECEDSRCRTEGHAVEGTA